VIATTTWPAANRYAARVCAQEHQTEKILNFGEVKQSQAAKSYYLSG